MSLLLIAMLFFQDHNHSGESFSPITAGNIVDINSFSVKVPSGTMLASLGDVEKMFKLTGAEYIPHCYGIFFSSSNTWKYSAAIQYLDNTGYVLTPPLTEESALANFSKQHLYSQTSVLDGTTVSQVIPPTYDHANQTFTIGMLYTYPPTEGKADDERELIFIKKFWLNGRDTLVMSVRATHEAFLSDTEDIDSILNSVSIKTVGAATKTTDSYLRLLGMSPVRSEPQGATANTTEENEELPLGVILGCIGLGLSGLALLIFAKVANDRAKKAAEDFP